MFLVQLEILALVLVDLSLICLAALALLATVPAAYVGGWLDVPPLPPGQQWVLLTTAGFLRFSSYFTLPALGLLALSLGLRRFVAQRLVSRA